VGPFEYIDNDRSQWKYTAAAAKHGIKPGHHMTDFCIYPRALSLRLLVLHRNQTASFNLGLLMQAMVEPYRSKLFLNGPLFTTAHAAVLNQNVAEIAGFIEECIARNGVDKVLLPEPWLTEFPVPYALDRVYSMYPTKDGGGEGVANVAAGEDDAESEAQR